MSHRRAPAIDLASNAAFAHGHPWDQYAWLRANDPVHWHPEPDGPGFWAITRYEDIRNDQPAAEAVQLVRPGA